MKVKLILSKKIVNNQRKRTGLYLKIQREAQNFSPVLTGKLALNTTVMIIKEIGKKLLETANISKTHY